MNIDALIRFYHELSPESVTRFPEFYSDDAYFKDPFNEVRGIVPIQRIFSHMFEQVDAPRFVVDGNVSDANGTMLIWAFSFRSRGWGKGNVYAIRGVSHLKFDADGKVNFHRDYWDTGEELYAKLPAIGTLMRYLRKGLAAT